MLRSIHAKEYLLGMRRTYWWKVEWGKRVRCVVGAKSSKVVLKREKNNRAILTVGLGREVGEGTGKGFCRLPWCRR